jgi:hypothetical protein
MIYIVDSPLTPYSHSHFMMHIVGEHTDEKINLFSIREPTDENSIIETLERIKPLLTASDIVLLAWTVRKRPNIDHCVEEIASICSVVVAAGNHSKDIETVSPAHLKCVITVGCLNKSGAQAKLSNFSLDPEKNLVWACGTNYWLDGRSQSGTSVSAAVYTGILAESKRRNCPLLIDFLLTKYHAKVAQELKASK